MAGTLLLRVTHGAASVTLRLEEDPERRGMALARAGAWALSYTDRKLAPVLREEVLELGRRFDAAAAPDGLDAASALVSTLVATLLQGSAIAPLSAAAARFPRWSGALRCREAPAGSFWPFDVELEGLRLGVRRLVKRDGLAAVDVRPALAWFERHGVLARAASEADGRTAVFAALDAATIDAALAAEAKLAAHDAASDEAARWLGDALGYPSCCVEAFLALSARDDAALAEGLLPRVPAPPASPLSMWLDAPLALHSHAACSLGCDATLARGRALLDALERSRPGFEAWWLGLARRVHLVDAEGGCWAVACEGALADGVRVVSAIESRPDGEVLRAQDTLTGGSLTVRDGRLVLAQGGRELVAPLGADHRAR